MKGDSAVRSPAFTRQRFPDVSIELTGWEQRISTLVKAESCSRNHDLRIFASYVYSLVINAPSHKPSRKYLSGLICSQGISAALQNFMNSRALVQLRAELVAYICMKSVRQQNPKSWQKRSK